MEMISQQSGSLLWLQRCRS